MTGIYVYIHTYIHILYILIYINTFIGTFEYRKYPIFFQEVSAKTIPNPINKFIGDLFLTYKYFHWFQPHILFYVSKFKT